MSGLFVSIYLDEDVSVLIAKLLKSRGFSAVTTQEPGHIGFSDSEQLAFATAREMAILTHNRDHFATLAREYLTTGKNHCGIIVAVRRSPYEVARRLLTLLDRVTADEMENQILFI